MDRYLEEADRILAVEDGRRALRLASVSGALAALAGPVAGGYAQRKEAAGLLDYDDLIDRTRTLLFDPGAAWVLYKLDGGLDHLLLDEVQDTAPQQWRIAHALTEEFFAGAGSRDRTRTVFAVGDRKQSIYSFQGADTAEFDRSHDELARRVRTSGQVFKDVGLDVSFRSTAPVLALVDAVFADPLARPGVVGPGETLTHYADRAGHAGLVELWPLAPRPDPPPHRPWTVPEQNQSQTSARQLLADTLADWIRDQTDGSVLLESKGRPLTAGDVLILVRRRDEFARALVRALKGRGVPVAGLDRMVLTDQPAVQDLMALADALLLPSDDLTFACLLTSPARRPDRRRAFRTCHGSAGHAVGRAARPRGRAPILAPRRRFVRPIARPRRLRLSLCAVRRGSGPARRPRAAVRPPGAGSSGTGGRTAECRADLCRAPPAFAAGVSALASPVGGGGEAGSRRRPATWCGS